MTSSTICWVVSVALPEQPDFPGAQATRAPINLDARPVSPSRFLEAFRGTERTFQ